MAVLLFTQSRYAYNMFLTTQSLNLPVWIKTFHTTVLESILTPFKSENNSST